eukprot:4509643-Pleurochrysis_carterae.AAC.1
MASRTVSKAAGDRLRRGYAPRPRWKWRSRSGASKFSSLARREVLGSSAGFDEASLCSVRAGIDIRSDGAFSCTDCSGRLTVLVEAEMSVIRPATARAMIILRSGG